MSADPHHGEAAVRRERLKELYMQARDCTRCTALASTRRSVVFGSGNANADLMFVGEAPGASEDEQGLPFVGRAGKLLDQLLGEIGLERVDVFIANTLKCLRYNANVQLGDGSWERIGRLVRTRYSGTVMSVAPDGALVARPVVGWHASPLAGRRVLKMTFASSKPVGRSRVSVELTADHPVLTERGYVAVEQLRDDDRVATGLGLSELAFDVACGTVLGDGCLQRRSSTLTFSHSRRQEEYACLKAELLDELHTSVELRSVAAVVGGTTYPVVLARTLAHRALRIMRGEFYRPHKVVPPWIEHELNERMLAFWFMDDGYTRIRSGGRRPLAEIATVSFSDADLQVLMRALRRLGLAAKASRRRLYFDADTTKRLCQKIAPYVPPAMRYKLDPEVEASIPFDRRRLTPGRRRVMFDRVEVEDASAATRADRTYFCIDVADTHNFVTAGGVVHNCRPPGNRDPLPVEIDNCRDYLMRQVELIEPAVICTLGNFSTKLLRDDPTGITRLHGQPEVIVLGRRAVHLYPIYHPAAALYTPRMLQTLREDFARLPELLSLGPPEQPLEAPEPVPETVPEATEAPVEAPEADQLGLF